MKETLLERLERRVDTFENRVKMMEARFAYRLSHEIWKTKVELGLKVDGRRTLATVEAAVPPAAPPPPPTAPAPTPPAPATAPAPAVAPSVPTAAPALTLDERIREIRELEKTKAKLIARNLCQNSFCP